MILAIIKRARLLDYLSFPTSDLLEVVSIFCLLTHYPPPTLETLPLYGVHKQNNPLNPQPLHRRSLYLLL